METDFTTIRLRKEVRKRLRKEINPTVNLSDGERIEICLNERNEYKTK